MPLSITSAARQLSDGNTVGTVLGTSLADLIGFYGVATPVAQPLGAAQLALTRGIGAGTLVQAVTSQTITAIAANTTGEGALSLYVAATTASGTYPYTPVSQDFTIVNVLTQQAGLTQISTRVSGSNIVGVTFANVTGAAVSPISAQAYAFVALRNVPLVSAVLTPAAVATSTTVEQLFTVPGVRVGEAIAVNKPSRTAGIDIVNVRAAANNQVGITFMNAGAGAGTNAITPTAGETYTFFQTGGIDAFSNFIQGAIQSGSPVATTPSQFVSSGFAMQGALVGDMVVGVNKTTAQSTVAPVGGFISAAGTLSVVLASPGAAGSATTNEIYNVVLYRQAPGALAQQYSVALTPASVGPNTTVSQFFSVTGLVNSSMVLVNKNIAQPGLGIAGYAVSNTNVLRIDYVNNTGASISPTPGEVYTILNFPQVNPNVGNAMIYSVTPQLNQAVVLENAIRNALTSVGLIAGA